MFNFQPSSKLDLKKFIETKYFKKILVIAGSKSFAQSGLKEFFLSLKEKNIKFFLKKKPFPEFKELLEIVKEIEIYLPDLIIAAGGGSVLDYAKIANVIELNSNIKREIISSACKLKKKIEN
jgi:alcohol dehydrogenase class IV